METKTLHDFKPPLVLLVEDETIIQTVHIQMLKKLGCEVDLAKTGEEAVAKANGQYDLIFMDIGLPGMNGLETTIKIRHQEPQNKYTPIIALTAYTQVIQQDCLMAGMDEIWFKPIKFTDLQKLIFKHSPRSIKHDE